MPARKALGVEPPEPSGVRHAIGVVRFMESEPGPPCRVLRLRGPVKASPQDDAEGVSGGHVGTAAFTIATMPARIGSGSIGHAATTAPRSGSSPGAFRPVARLLEGPYSALGAAHALRASGV